MADHASKACLSAASEISRLGWPNWGIVGDSNHSYGYHRGSPSSGDYSLSGVANRVVDPGAACAIDIASDGSSTYRRWVAWMFDQYEKGNLPHVVEIIGSLDGSYVQYAATSTGRKRTRYNGTGHDTWTHVSIGRSYANNTNFGKEILGGWTNSGYTGATTDVQEDADMTIVQLANGYAALLCRGTNDAPYIRVITMNGEGTEHGWRKLANTTVGSGLAGVSPDGKELVLATLHPTTKEVRVFRVEDARAETLVVRPTDIGGKGYGTPDVAVDGGRLVVTVVGDKNVIYLNTSADGGTSWRGWWDSSGKGK